jgi:hypothetical protein
MNTNDETLNNAVEAASVFDLAQLDTLSLGEAGVEMPVKHPGNGVPLINDDGSPMTLTVASADSDKFQKAGRAARDRRNAVGGRRAGPGSVKAAEIDADSIELLVAVVVNWNVTLDGKKPTCAPASVRAAFKRFPWLMRQVDAYIADDANFLRPSARP